MGHQVVRRLLTAVVAGVSLSVATTGLAYATEPDVPADPPITTVPSAPSAPDAGAPTNGSATEATTTSSAMAFSLTPDPNAPTLVLKPDTNPISLSSKPGASKTIWLVFPGGELTGTQWNEGRNLQDPAKTPVPAANPIDFDPVGLDSTAMRTEVFQRIAEYFSPFDVNITTVRPSDAALSRDSLDDQEYGGAVLFTNEMFSSGLQFDDADDADGIAHLGTFGDPTDYYAWVSTTDMNGDPKFLADVAAHELGHTLGLDHQGYGTQDYYYPQGLWAPIMGKGRYSGSARWSDAQYPNSKGGQDDLAVMTDASANGTHTRYFLRADGSPAPAGSALCGASNGDMWLLGNAASCAAIADTDRAYVDSHDYYNGRLNYAVDEHGDTAATATTLAPNGTATGIISTNTDKDVFRIDLATSGALSLNATTASYGPMLDVLMTVRDQNGSVVATIDPRLGLVDDDRYGPGLYRSLIGTGADTQLTLAAGTYTVTIEGTGFGDLSQVTLNDSSMAAARYGSLGQYSLSASFLADAVIPPPVVDPNNSPPAHPGGVGAANSSDSGSTASATGHLASTGGAVPTGLCLVGLLLVILGAFAVTMRRRSDSARR